MNDKDIIKALECCANEKTNCRKCVFYDKSHLTVSACRFELLSDILDLINRQKAEIERLRKENEVMKTNCNSMCKSMPNIAKAERAEAIKEFAERLKGKSHISLNQCGEMKPLIYFDDIDNLVKEMTENDFKE